MDGATDRGRGFMVLDGGALVIAAAVASIHMRTSVERAAGGSWGLVWLTFAGVGLTSAGPILLMMRRYGRRSEGYPGLGEGLWGVLGVPWLLTAPLRSPRLGAEPGTLGLYGLALTLSLGLACLVVLAVLWKSWVQTPPGARPAPGGPISWTERLGTAISVAWPLQGGFLLLVLDSENLPAPR